jgi:hypothetical protein
MFTGFGVPTEATAPVRVALAVHPPIETSQLLVTLNLRDGPAVRRQSRPDLGPSCDTKGPKCDIAYAEALMSAR